MSQKQPQVDVQATVIGDTQRAMFSLIEENKALRKDRQTLIIEGSLWRDLLKKYGGHTGSCGAKFDASARCTCGFSECIKSGFAPRLTDY